MHILQKKFSLDNIKMSWLTNVATQSSQESCWSSWSGLSQPFTSNGEKRDLINDEKKQWWESFCSQSKKKDKSLQSAGSSSQQKEDEPESCLDTNMNYVNTNRINNFIYMYNIQNTKENFKKLEHVIEKRDFAIYKQILYMVDNCRIVEEDSSGITVEIDLFERRKLLVHLTNWEMENLKRKLVMVILLEMYF